MEVVLAAEGVARVVAGGVEVDGVEAEGANLGRIGGRRGGSVRHGSGGQCRRKICATSGGSQERRRQW